MKKKRNKKAKLAKNNLAKPTQKNNVEKSDEHEINDLEAILEETEEEEKVQKETEKEAEDAKGEAKSMFNSDSVNASYVNKKRGDGLLKKRIAILLALGVVITGISMTTQYTTNQSTSEAGQEVVLRDVKSTSSQMVTSNGTLNIDGLVSGASYTVTGSFVDESGDAVTGGDVKFQSDVVADDANQCSIPLSFKNTGEFWGSNYKLRIDIFHSNVLISTKDVEFSTNMSIILSSEKSDDVKPIISQEKKVKNPATTSTKEVKHEHRYAPVYEGVELAAEGFWKTVVEEKGYWSETPIIEEITIYTCNDCGRDITQAVNEGNETPCSSNCLDGYTKHVEDRQTGTDKVWIDEVTSEEWVETAEARVDKQLIGHKCDDCGQWK